MAASNSLQDNFNDNSIDLGNWNLQGAGTPSNFIKEQNSRLEITTDGTNGDYFTLGSNVSYDLTSSYIAVQIVDGLSTLTNVNGVPLVLANTSTFDNTQNKLFWSLDGSGGTVLIQTYKVISGVQTQITSGNFDVSNYKFVKIRESGGTIYFDYSSDSIAWNNTTSLANPFAVTALYSGMQAGQYGVQASTYTYKFDNFNLFPRYAGMHFYLKQGFQ